MDLRTIINLIALGNGLTALIFIIYLFIYQDKRRNIRLFTLSKIFQTINWIIIIAFHDNPSPGIMIAANVFHYPGVSLEILSFSYFSRENPKKYFWIILMVNILAITLYSVFSTNILIRVLITSILFFALYGFMGILLLPPKKSFRIQQIVGIIAFLFAIIQLSRGLYSFITNTELPIFAHALPQAITGYFYIIVTFTFPVLFLLILKEKDNITLNELNTTKNKLFRIIGHDLRLPISQLIQIAEIIDLKNENIEPENLTELSNTIKTSTIRTSKLLDNLLNWAQSQSNELTIKAETIPLSEIINENRDLYKEKSRQKMLDIKNNIQEDQIVFCDRSMLNIVLRNLISNAIKFSYRKGMIEINATSNKNNCMVSVKDHGTGIPSQDLDKIFKIGSSSSKPGTENEKGTGIGLSLSKEFIEKNGGKIWCESIANKGSVFYFTLPLC